MKRSGSRSPERVGDILRESIRALGWGQRLREEEVFSRWEETVGPQIAAHARPSHASNHRLTIVTESPVWTQQLSLLRTELLRRIARVAGDGVITELYFVTGRIEPPAPPEPARPHPQPPAEIPSALEEQFAAIPDAEVREAVRSLCRASLARRP